ncbi:TPA: hypothetical protein DCX15_05515, partial [bacterium]|nr:hypothetical protein [bacterium]
MQEMFRIIRWTTIFLLLVVVGTNLYGGFPEGTTPSIPKEEYAKGVLLLKFKEGKEPYFIVKTDGLALTGIPSIDRLNRGFKVREMERLFPTVKKEPGLPDLTTIYKLTLPEEIDIPTAVSVYERDPNIEYAEPDYICHIFTSNRITPNDPLFSEQWGPKKIQCEAAWDIDQGSPEIVICISDTGIDWNHPDLANNIWRNMAEINSKPGVDDDGNGYIDDYYGWNFAGVSNNNPMDDHGHGTHCAGIASAATNNGIGIVGVNWYVRLMAVKGLTAEGSGYATWLAEGIVYAADNGANVISMSWGGYGDSQTVENALNYAYAKGVVLVAAAGNKNSSSAPLPAKYANVMAIAATDSNDSKAWFSNYGDWIDVAAPGVKILSTVLDNNYASWSGTSMACPHVSGLAGLILSQDPRLTPAEVREIIRKTADNIDAINPGYEGKLGTGRINAHKAILRSSSIKCEIIRPTLAWYKGTITIEATASDSQGTPISLVEFQYSTDGTDWYDCPDSPDPTPPFKIEWQTRPENGTDSTVYLRARARNSAGKYSPYALQQIKVDNEAPTTNHNYDNLWHTQDFTITLTPDDQGGSGVTGKNIHYKITGQPLKNVADNGPPRIELEGPYNTLEYWSVDSLGNTEPKKGLKGIKLDKTPPDFFDFSKDPVDLTENSTGPFKVSLRVDDLKEGSGLYGKIPQLDYCIGTGSWVGYQDMTYEEGDTWSFLIPEPPDGWKPYGGETIYYRARCSDVAGNLGISEEQNELIDPYNDPPTIKVTYPPVGGATADTSYTIRWIDSDPDSDASISLYYEEAKTNLSREEARGNIPKAYASSCIFGYPDRYRIEHLIDGLYGDSHSWRPSPRDLAPWIKID